MLNTTTLSGKWAKAAGVVLAIAFALSLLFAGQAYACDDCDLINHKTVDITATKVWDDADDKDGLRPDSVTVNLVRDGVVIDSAILEEANSWTHTWTVPACDNGACDNGLHCIVCGQCTGGFESIVCGECIVYAEEDFEIEFCPDCNSTLCFVCGDCTGSDDIVCERCYKFVDHIICDCKGFHCIGCGVCGGFLCPDCATCVEYIYTIQEVSVEGYTTVITGSVADGFVITNKHVPAEDPIVPEDPETPVTPEDPVTPDTPVTPEDPKPVDPTPEQPLPTTGDTTNLFAVGFAALAAALVAAFASLKLLAPRGSHRR